MTRKGEKRRLGRPFNEANITSERNTNAAAGDQKDTKERQRKEAKKERK